MASFPDIAMARKVIADDVIQHISSSLKRKIDNAFREFLHQQIYLVLEQTEERCKIFFKDQIDGGKVLNTILEQSSHMEDYLTQCFRQRNLQLCSTPDSTGLNTNSQHVAAIRNHSAMLLDNLQLEGTILLDTLIEKEILSDTGRRSILSRKTENERHIAFLDFVGKKFDSSSFRSILLPALHEDHPRLAEVLQKEIDTKVASVQPIKQCQSCEAKSKIRIRKFASELHKTGVITETLYLDLVSPNITQSAKWNELLTHTKTKPKAVMKALCCHDPDLFNTLKSTKQTLLICTCDQLSTDESTVVQRSDITDTGENEEGEADVARMSDFSSEVSSPKSFVNSFVDIEVTSPKQRVVQRADSESNNENTFIRTVKSYITSGGDGGNKFDQMAMRAPLPPVKRDHPFFSSKKAVMKNTSAKQSSENIGWQDRKFECFTTTKDVLDMEIKLSRKFKEVKILKHKLMKLKRKTIKIANFKLHGQKALGNFWRSGKPLD